MRSISWPNSSLLLSYLTAVSGQRTVTVLKDSARRRYTSCPAQRHPGQGPGQPACDLRSTCNAPDGRWCRAACRATVRWSAGSHRMAAVTASGRCWHPRSRGTRTQTTRTNTRRSNENGSGRSSRCRRCPAMGRLRCRRPSCAFLMAITTKPSC